MSDLILGEAVRLFLNEQIASTRKSYLYDLNAMRDFVGASRKLSDIRPEHLIEFGQKVRSRPTVRSPATYNKFVKTVRTFFNWWIRVSDHPGKSPALALKRLRQTTTVSREKAMPEALYRQLLDFAKWDRRTYALVLFLGDAGNRIGGAAGLRWSDIDLHNRRAIVVEKGQPARPVFFREECGRALMRWHQEQSARRRGDYVFSEDGRLIKNDNLGQFFRRACIRSGIGSWGPHSLRHRKGYQLADARVSPTIAAQLLGHSDVKMTLENYYPDDWDRVRQAVEELGYDPAQPLTTPKIIDAGWRTG